MKKILFTLSILVAFTFAAHAQTNLDSLYAVWLDETKADSTRAKAYHSYSYSGFLYSNPDSAFSLAQELLVFCEKKNYLKGQALAFSTLGLSRLNTGKYPESLEYFNLSLKIGEEIGNRNIVASALNNIGSVYNYTANYTKTLEYYSLALKLFEQDKNQKQIAGTLFNMGYVYMNQGNNPKALLTFNRSLKIGEELNDNRIIANCLNTVGSIYWQQNDYPTTLEYFNRALKLFKEINDKSNVANILLNISLVLSEEGDFQEALNYTKSALKIHEELGGKRGISTALNQLGSQYKKQNNYPNALELYNRALVIKNEVDDKHGISGTLNNIGSIYQLQGDYDKALQYCMEGLALTEEIGVLEFQKASCQCLYDTYKAMGKGDEALLYLEKMRVVEDSLNSEETSKKLQQMEFAKQALADSIANVEADRLVEEAHQDEVRKKNRTRNILVGGALLLIMLAGGIYSRLRYIRKAKNIIEEEKDRSNNLLLNILPADIAEELKIHGKAEARDFDLVSILFTDFKGFTAASAKLSAADLVNEINTCFEAFDHIMGKYKIEKIKTIGDAYMAAGGLPVSTDDSVKNTVLAALEMQDFIGKRKAEMDAQNKPAFEMRVGIHTGPVVAGIVGVKKFQYDIWGDTVNTASRMESSGEVGEVNISQATFETLKDDPQFAFESRGKIEAKGKGEIEMYFVSRA